MGAAPSARDASATRRTVTIVFADLTGSTTIGERMDPEALRALMGPFYTAMRAQVESRGGRIAKFQGDGVMAVFGLDAVHEDDAVRALSAAVAMQQAVAELPVTHDVMLSLKVGVNTGEVVSSAGDEDLVGDAVNVASRLEGAAAPGEVIVGEETWRLTRSIAVYDPIAPLTLKGKADPVPAYRLVSLDGAEEAETSAVPFVGREAELERLMEAFDDVLHSSAAGSVTIVGSPGLGKTRLTREFAERLEGRALVIETRCDAASSYAFAPVAEAFRTAGGIEESAEPEIVLERVMDLIPEAEPERDRIARLIAALLGAGPPASTEETFWAIRRMIEIAGATTPVVQILDDMHWAEPVLLDLIEHLIEWVQDVPLLVVVTGRPELREIRPSLTERAIALEGLDESSTGLLARELLGGDPLPVELLARLPSSTEGNPLFVRELVRMLVDDGVLQRMDDGWRVTIDVDAIDVPPTIHSLLSARVDRLRPEERSVVELASVIGREFYKGALLELAPAAFGTELDVHLESLRRKELVEPAGTYWIDEPVYRFHHVLIRDAAYRRLLKESRAELHGRVAAWLERKTGGLVGEHDELIGYHLEQSYASRRQLGPLDDDARAVGRRAAALLGTAARRALDRDDLPSAASLSGRALAVLDADDEARAEVLIVRCEALLGMGDVTTATPSVHELEQLAASSPRLSHWATCFTGQLVNLSDPSRLHEIEERVRTAALEFASLGDTAGAAKAHTVHAATLARLGRFADCETALDDALTAARQVDDRGRITSVLEALPQAQLWGPNVVSRAGGRCLDVVRLVRITTQSPAVEATSIRCQAVLEALRGRSDPARGMLRKVRRMQSELGLRHGLLETELSHGVIELVAGDPATAEEHLRLAHEGFGAMGIEVSAAQAAALRARALLAMGEADEADALAAESERLGGDDLKTSIAWRAVRAEILSGQGKHDEARALAEIAVELATSTDALIDHGDALMALASVHRAAGDSSAARSTEERAIALYERKGATALVQREPAPRPDVVPPQRVPVENAATRAVARWDAAFLRRDWNAAADALSADMIHDDRRAALANVRIGREAFVDTAKYSAEAGVSSVESTYLDVRGDRLALRRVRLSDKNDPATWDNVQYIVDEADDTGRLARMVVFDEKDVDAARAELDARAAALESLLENVATRAIARFEAAFIRRDWDAVRAVYSPDVVSEERRTGYRSVQTGRDEFLAMAQALASIGVTRIENTYLALRGDRLALRRTRFSNAADVESFEEVVLCVDEADENGLLVRMFVFNENDIDAAMTELDLRAAALGAEAFDNAATRAIARFVEAFLAQDWELYANVLSDDVLVEDRRSALRTSITGRAQVIAVHKELLRIGADRVENVYLAVRGDRLALRRERVSSENDPESFDSVHLILDEVGADGRLVRMIVFEERDAASAWAELDARARALDNDTSVENAAARVDDMVGARDWDAADNLFAADVTLEDRRAGLGDLRVGRDAVVGALKGYASLGDLAADQDWVAVRSDRLGLRRVHFHDPSDPQAPRYELLNLYEVDSSGQIRRLVALDDLEEALAQLDARASAIDRTTTGGLQVEQLGIDVARVHERTDDRPSGLENTATRVVDRFTQYMVRGDSDNAFALNADDIVFEDRRRGLTDQRHGKAGAIEINRSIAEVGAREVSRETLAIRGDRLSLERQGFVGNDFEVTVLRLVEVNTRGDMSAVIVFDDEDLDTAIAELDERFIAGEGAACAEPLRRALGIINAFNTRDWATVGEQLTDDFVLRDHHPVGLGELHGRDEWIAAAKVFTELLDESLRTVPVAVHAFSPRAVLGQTHGQGRTTDGNPVDVSRLVLACIDRDRISLVEFFPAHELDRALARFRELDGEAPLFENAASRMNARLDELFVRRDWDGLERLYADDVLSEDYRSGLKNRRVGRGATMETHRGADFGVTTFESTPIAVRGERLCLARLRGAGDRYEAELLRLIELNDEGRIGAAHYYDVHNLEAAVADLDRRYYEAEGAAFGATRAFDDAILRGARTNSWEDLRAITDPSFVAIDHRLVSIEPRDTEGFIESTAMLLSLLQDIRGYFAWHPRQTTTASVANLVYTGRSTDGVEIEASLLGVLLTRNGKAVRLEIYPPEQLDDALARFDELVASSPPLENACARMVRRLWGAYAVADFEAIDALNSPSIRFEDRRAGLRIDGTGRDAYLTWSRGVRELPGWQPEEQKSIVAIRGERLCLVHIATMIGDDEPFEIEAYILDEIDDDGLFSVCIAFDADDLEGALRELDARYTSGEGAAVADTFTAVRDVAESFNNRDWNHYQDTLSDDFTLVDHRPAYLGTVESAEEWIAGVPVLVELKPDIRYRLVALHAIEPGRAAYLIRATGTTVEGAQIEITFHQVAVVRDGRVAHLEFFPIEKLDEALTLFDELDEQFAAGEGREFADMLPVHRTIENAATQAGDRVNELFEKREWTSMRDVWSEDTRYEDRRPTMHSTATGPDERVRNLQTAEELGCSRIEAQTLAVRGDRLALRRHHHVGGTTDYPYIVETLVVLETDDAGRIVATIGFDVDDTAAAFDELTRRWLATEEPTESAPPLDELDRASETSQRTLLPDPVELENACTRRNLDGWRLIEADDWQGHVQLVAEDVVFEDRRPGVGWSFQGRDRYLENARVGGRGVQRRIEPIAVRGEHLALERIHVEMRDGFQTDVLHLAEMDEHGRMCRQILFDPNDTDDAFAELDARWVARAGEAAERSRLAVEMLDAINGSDWDRLRELMPADVVYVDHRPGSFGTLGVEAYIERSQQLERLGTHFRIRITKSIDAAGRPDGLLVLRREGIDENGSAVRWDYLGLGDVRDGRIVSFESFSIEQFDQALERAREIADAATIENESVRVRRRLHEAWEQGDWDAAAELYAPDIEWEDRRGGLRHTTIGRDEQLAEIKASYDVAMEQIRFEFTPIAVRGERMALGHLRSTSAAPELSDVVVEFLFYSEIDGNGRLVRAIGFDLDDRDAAFAELEARWNTSAEAAE